MKKDSFCEYTLQEVQCQDSYGSVDGPFGSNLPASSYIEKGIPIIRGVNLSLGEERFKDFNYKFISEETAQKLHRSSCRPNDIVFTKKGTLGQTGLVPNDSVFKYFILSSNQMRIRLDESIANPLYVYYFVSCQQSQDRILADAMTSGVPKINLTYLRKFKVLLPEINIQRKIAAILSAYDDLIENNKRRIALLENMAEEIYREWFVRFRFPGCQGAKFEKGIPNNWKYEKLGDICSLVKRGISPKYDDEALNLVINQKCIRNSRIDLSEARRHDTNVSEEKYIRFGDALINSTGVGTLGRVSVVEFKSEKITVDSHVTICRANTQRVNPIYLANTITKLQAYFEFMAAGSTGQVELNRSLISGIKVLVPEEELMDKFEKQIIAIVEQKQSLFKINDNLTKTKGMLLPRLISGKLSVEDLDIQYPPSMQEDNAA